MNLRAFHRASAIFIAAFACFHIINHLASLAGVATHIAFMELARQVYRQIAVELLLLACIAFQVGSGLWFVARGWRSRRGAVAWLQAASGAMLAFFLLVHVGAVLYGRGVLGLDTNFYYAAAGFHVAPYPWFFGPYYFLAVLALFAHVGCAAYWRWAAAPRRYRRAALVVPVIIGAVVALLIVLSLAGQFQPVDVPAKYKATYIGKSKI